MNEANAQKEGIQTKVMLGIGALAIIVVVGLLLFFVRKSDPAAQGPIPYKKFDYGAEMEKQKRTLNRQTPSDPNSTR